jgi:hypothetical protein
MTNQPQVKSLLKPYIIRSDHPVVKTLIQNIRAQSVEYYGALDLSIQTVEDGYTFCVNAEALCDYLVDRTNTTEELREYICVMRKLAKRAHEDAKIVSEKFRRVRMNLMQVRGAFLFHYYDTLAQAD